MVLRLGSNLILTRLLFPEVFGLMALIMTIMQGLNQFSDLGTGPAIMQSKRGDDRDFLDTAWTMQMIRGGILFAAACALSWPLSMFYGEPALIYLIPVASISLLIYGAFPTKEDQAYRHMTLGVISVIDIAAQIVGIVVAIAFAIWLQSVWAFIISSIAGTAARVLMVHLFIPGALNKLRWDTSAARELFSFGRWILPSTVAGFFYAQGDKLFLAKVLPLASLGIYNIGLFLGSFPVMLATTVVHKVFIPIYRENPPGASAQNFRTVRKIRFLATGCALVMMAAVGLAGPMLVDLLYDPRYASAGAVVVLVSVGQMPTAIFLSYDQAALASGDSYRFFLLAALRACVTLAALFIGFHIWGLAGAILGQAVAILAIYPAFMWLSRTHGAWDPLHDVIFILIAGAYTYAALTLHWHEIAALFG